MNILVLCTGNSCRSQMAETLLQKEIGAKSKVYSAGLNPQLVNKYAIKVMSEIGHDISQHTSNHIDDYKDISFKYVITVCSNADKNCPIFSGNATKVHIPFDDPADAIGTDEEILDEFRRVRDEIKVELTKWLNSL